MSIERSRYDWPKLIEKLGISTFYTCAICFALWQVVLWVGPRLDMLVNKHLEFVDKAGQIMEENKDTQKKNTQILESVSDTQEEAARTGKEFRTLTEDLHEKVGRIGDDVTKIKEKVLQ